MQPSLAGVKIMRRTMIVTICAAMGLGCASSGEIQQGGYAHLAKADRYEAHGDHYRADKERAAASKQFAKANQRAYQENHFHRYWF
jgi:hypothetical protein